MLQVKIASFHDIPFLATGGGHGVSLAMAHVQDGLQLDLAKLNSVRFDTDTGFLTVGGSTKFSQLIQPLNEAGAYFRTWGLPSFIMLCLVISLNLYWTALGTAYCVGIVGVTLGAGVSASQGLTGLLSDLLQEVQMVTADGQLVTASRTQNVDLFWAVRGAGANFGIVTSATFKVPPLVNGGNVTNANYMFSASKALEVYTFLASLDDGMPAELALNIGSLIIPGTDQVSQVNSSTTPDNKAGIMLCIIIIIELI